ncbi:hypothetical protein [Mucilaginibacter gracilis]|nr:hypothetical protein [Mucilaginibacter gracilis]
MKTLFILFISFAFISLTNAQSVDYSGSYRIDTAKTKWGNLPYYVLPKSVKIVQEKDSLTISKYKVNEKSEDLPVVSYCYKFVSPSLKTKGANGNTTVSSLKFNNDGSFVIMYETVGLDGKFLLRNVETWRMDGKELTINSAVEQDNGVKYNITGNYDKI